MVELQAQRHFIGLQMDMGLCVILLNRDSMILKQVKLEK